MKFNNKQCVAHKHTAQHSFKFQFVYLLPHIHCENKKKNRRKTGVGKIGIREKKDALAYHRYNIDEF